MAVSMCWESKVRAYRMRARGLHAGLRIGDPLLRIRNALGECLRARQRRGCGGRGGRHGGDRTGLLCVHGGDLRGDFGALLRDERRLGRVLRGGGRE
jgi:hypothetical protein